MYGSTLGVIHLFAVVGFVLDVLGHRGILASHLPGHVVMAVAATLALTLHSLPWDGSPGARVALVGVLLSALAIAGQFVPAFAPLLLLAALLVLPRALSLRAGRTPTQLAYLATVGGLVLVLVGGVVDAIHHAVLADSGLPHVQEEVLTMPGHQLQLLGWLAGAAGGAGLARLTARDRSVVDGR